MKTLTINTRKGIYRYRPVHLFYGRKKINKIVSKSNLLDFKAIMDHNQIQFGIIYGTLLGAIREHDFIEHDEDVDVFILNEYKSRFMSLLFTLRAEGFEVARFEGDLLSLIRNDDYIDIYFFRKNIFGQRVCNSDILSNSFFLKNEKIYFLGQEFGCPQNPIQFLEKAYGRDWRIPKQNSPANVLGIKGVLKKKLKKIYRKMKLFIFG